MTARLSIIDGPAQGEEIVVPTGALTLGRASPTVGGRLGGDLGLSRRHARIRVVDDGCLLVEDLGSTNGTYVNDEPITDPCIIEAGDVLRVGSSLLQVVEVDGQTDRFAAGQPGGAVALREAVHVGGGIRADREGVAAGRDIHGGIHRQTVTASNGGSAAGRDIYHQEQYYDPDGFGMIIHAGGLPRVLFTIGILVSLAGFAIVGYAMLFAPAEYGPDAGLGPWLPLGAVLFFAGIVLGVIAQLSMKRPHA